MFATRREQSQLDSYGFDAKNIDGKALFIDPRGGSLQEVATWVIKEKVIESLLFLDGKITFGIHN